MEKLDETEYPPRRIITSDFSPRFPVSYGIILKATDTNNILMVRRQHSFSLIYVLRGDFMGYNLANYLTLLTKSELNKLKVSLNSFDTFEALLEETFGPQETYRQGAGVYETDLIVYQRLLDAKDLIISTTHNSIETEWYFPKGRPIPEDDSELATALREFTEETGIASDLVTLTGAKVWDKRTALNGRQYENLLFPAICEQELDVSKHQNKEIAECRWFPVADVKNRVRRNINELFL